MFPTPTQGAIFPANIVNPPSVGWSQLIDYQGGSAPVYVMWYPAGSNQQLVGYIQKFTYVTNQVTASQWAIMGNGPNPQAIWANRTSLTYS